MSSLGSPCVLHVSASDRKGGAALGALRLVEAQRRAGIDARMLVTDKVGDDRFVEQLDGFLVTPRIHLARALARRVATSYAANQPHAMRSFGWFSTGLGRAIIERAPDIVQWHWVGAEVAGLGDLAIPRIPAIWTCRDHWIGAGAEHFPICDDHLTGYGGRRRMDPDRRAFAAKQRRLAQWRPQLVCLSQWSAEQLRRSPLTRERPIEIIPNTLDFATFLPMESGMARKRLGLPADSHVVLFGAQGGTSDERKGFALLQAALERLPAPLRARTVLLTFGGKRRESSEMAGLPAIELGRLDAVENLRTAYCAASLFANPSLAETFGNTTLESLACGTPCIAFATGAAPEMIDSALMGEVVALGDGAAFAEGLGTVLRQPDDPGHRAERHRRVADRSSERRVVAAYSALYDRMLGRGRADGPS